MTTCPHGRMRAVSLVLRGTTGKPEGVALSVECAACGMKFQFIGIETTSTVLLNEEHTELRVLIAPGEPE